MCFWALFNFASWKQFFFVLNKIVLWIALSVCFCSLFLFWLSLGRSNYYYYFLGLLIIILLINTIYY